MAIPGIFDPVEYQEMVLIDGGMINNFPVDLAKKKYPKAEIIGVALNKFQENQSMKNIFENLNIAFEILLRGQTVEKL
jgi:NTE family protein